MKPIKALKTAQVIVARTNPLHPFQGPYLWVPWRWAEKRPSRHTRKYLRTSEAFADGFKTGMEGRPADETDQDPR